MRHFPFQFKIRLQAQQINSWTMFRTKKEVDKQARTILSKLRDNEVNITTIFDYFWIISVDWSHVQNGGIYLADISNTFFFRRRWLARTTGIILCSMTLMGKRENCCCLWFVNNATRLIWPWSQKKPGCYDLKIDEHAKIRTFALAGFWQPSIEEKNSSSHVCEKRKSKNAAP